MASLSDRMKEYEDVFRHYLPNRMPVILRIDGKGFSRVTANLEKPFDNNFITIMDEVALALVKDIQGAQIAFIQSDEISILIHSYKTIQSQSYFNNNINKITSITAGIASATFTANSHLAFNKIVPCAFDARVFVVPEFEVVNYFINRQQDCSRNSVQMLARSLYSHKMVEHKSIAQMHDMIHAKGKNWNDFSTRLKRGRCIVKKEFFAPAVDPRVVETPNLAPENQEIGGMAARRFKWIVDNEIPIFTEDREYINKHLAVEVP